MVRAGFLALLAATLMLSSGVVGQDQKDEKKVDPPVKVKGRLPANWGRLGLSDSQVQAIYRVQNKHNEEIAKLKEKIKELEAARERESKAILTTEQKKRLDDILTGKDK
jgi:hypothetical protein